MDTVGSGTGSKSESGGMQSGRRASGADDTAEWGGVGELMPTEKRRS